MYDTSFESLQPALSQSVKTLEITLADNAPFHQTVSQMYTVVNSSYVTTVLLL